MCVEYGGSMKTKSTDSSASGISLASAWRMSCLTLVKRFHEACAGGVGQCISEMSQMFNHSCKASNQLSRSSPYDELLPNTMLFIKKAIWEHVMKKPNVRRFAGIYAGLLVSMLASVPAFALETVEPGSLTIAFTGDMQTNQAQYRAVKAFGGVLQDLEHHLSPSVLVDPVKLGDVWIALH